MYLYICVNHLKYELRTQCVNKVLHLWMQKYYMETLYNKLYSIFKSMELSSFVFITVKASYIYVNVFFNFGTIILFNLGIYHLQSAFITMETTYIYTHAYLAFITVDTSHIITMETSYVYNSAITIYL